VNQRLDVADGEVAERGHGRASGLQLERDDFSLNRHPDLASCLSMIFSENRCTLFGIML
jgi:hypothetical protein